MSESIWIKLHTTIDDGGEKEYHVTTQSGIIYRRNNMHVLMFEEQLGHDETVKNLITIVPEKEHVSIKRSGSVSMNQKFIKHQLTENVFQHPHGSFHMETFTKTMDYQLTASKSKLNIEYTVKLNGQKERNHSLSLVYKLQNPS
ncbi:MAG TPA: DUF1934 domain-containing protein [Bacillota bacterium]